MRSSPKSFKRCVKECSSSQSTSRASSEKSLLVRARTARLGSSQKDKKRRSISSISNIVGIVPGDGGTIMVVVEGGLRFTVQGLYMRERDRLCCLGHAIIGSTASRRTRRPRFESRSRRPHFYHVLRRRAFVACFRLRALRRRRVVVPRRSISLAARCSLEASAMEEQARGRQSAHDRGVHKFATILCFGVDGSERVGK